MRRGKPVTTTSSIVTAAESAASGADIAARNLAATLVGAELAETLLYPALREVINGMEPGQQLRVFAGVLSSMVGISAGSIGAAQTRSLLLQLLPMADVVAADREGRH
jgi:hypothetical protein